ncbi:unnamed protein product [Polarella glacialis]|uniref:RNA-editing substrate-binding complex 6 protein domain-containing protein n=1 Tax=Polarella glacialis TaxID=89957 RepID=A0A813I5D5_POLGL|nr:unnamed protein product [Polarella glacialis]CAE8678368.1 unnamed protein product [Polarella glacialis]
MDSVTAEAGAASARRKSCLQAVIDAESPLDILALTLQNARELDALTAVTALEAIARHPQRHVVERDMRFAKLVFDINYMLHSSYRQFRARELARCAWAFASLGLKHPTMMYCIGMEVAKKASEFKVSELSSLLLAFAHARIRDLGMMETATLELVRRIGQCTPKDLADVAWALAMLRYNSNRTMAAISDATGSLMKDFSSAQLAQVIWSLDAFGHQRLVRDLLRSCAPVKEQTSQGAVRFSDRSEILAAAGIFGQAPSLEDQLDLCFMQPVAMTLTGIASGQAISSSHFRGLAEKAPHLGFIHTARVLQPTGVRVTSGRKRCPGWAVEARDLIRSIFDDSEPLETMPMSDKEERVSIPVVDKNTYQRNMADFGVDNFGKIGGRCLLNQLGIGRAGDHWVAQAKQFIAAWADGVGKRSDDWKANTIHRRIYVFAEYHFASTLWPMAPLLEGTSFQLNGLRSDPEMARRPWLCAVPLPISKWVDRTLCAEFQLLVEVCEMLNRSGIEMTSPELRHSVYGYMNMYLSEPSCVSCVGGMKQFQTLFPGVDLLVECSSVVEPLMARMEMDLASRVREDTQTT